MARRRRRKVEVILAEHAKIIASLAELESTLTGPCTDGEAAWRRRLHRELRPLINSLGRHNARAEGPDGVFGDIEVAIGHGHELTTARRLHVSILRRAHELAAALEPNSTSPIADDVRSRGRLLGAEIRRHHALEADLVQHLFNQETGTGD